MNAKALRLYGASDLRLEDVELEPAGEDGVIVEIVANSVCVSDYKCVTLGAGQRRVPDDIATHPVMIGHEMSGIVREVGEKWKGRFSVGQRVGIQPTLNVPGHELDSVIGFSWRGVGGESTHVRLPSVAMEMVTHVGGLDSAADATLGLMSVPGGKRLVYTHVSMPMTAIADFADKGRTDPLFAALDRICAAHNGLWSKEAEDYLLANAPKFEIGEPKERIAERSLPC